MYETGLTKDPRAILASIAPYYDFMDAGLKPWHLKVIYQLDDEKGNPGEQGVFEYWWASPKVYRSTWRRGNATHSDWHTADGRHFTQTVGEPLSIYEFWLQSALLSPLPGTGDLDPTKSTLVSNGAESSNSHTRCIMVAPSEIKETAARSLPFATYPEYCVNKAMPLLLGYYTFGNVLVKCVSFTHMQGKSMPREIYIGEGSREILSAKAEPVDAIAAADPALIPAAGATMVNLEKAQISPAIASGLLVKRVAPTYPDDAKAAHAQGEVILQVTIGPEGRVQGVRLVRAPAPSLALAAFLAVSQWDYKPYRVNGEPVAAETTVKINFPLSN